MRRKQLLLLKGFFIFISLLLFQNFSFGQNMTISGSVKDSSGAPLSGVSVTVQGGKTGTTTNATGHYSLLAPENSVLIFSYVGYETAYEVATGGTLDVVLRHAATSVIDEVVVVGYGRQKKANLTGAVSSIDSKSLDSRPVANTGQALQGLIPGLNLSTAGLGGELNQNLAINIRGGGTIGSGSNSAPLVLIDGMEGDLNAINIQDIDNISVLKDAGASAIYGSRAPFGVILVTTKKGRSGKANINYNNSFRWTMPIGLPKMLDSYKFALYWNEAAQNDGEGAKFSQAVLDKIIAYQKGTLDSGTTPVHQTRGLCTQGLMQIQIGLRNNINLLHLLRIII